jgi:putative transposase
VLDKLPPRLQPRANRGLHAMRYAESAPIAQPHARVAWRVSAQVPQGGRVAYCQWGAAGYVLRLSRRALEASRTTNVIVSRFATVRLRERATRGASSRTKGLLMAFKLLDMMQLR